MSVPMISGELLRANGTHIEVAHGSLRFFTVFDCLTMSQLPLSYMANSRDVRQRAARRGRPVRRLRKSLQLAARLLAL